MPQTMFEKIWDAHKVRETEGQTALLYIDLHLVHEVTSPQAFDGLRLHRMKALLKRQSQSAQGRHGTNGGV